MFGLIILYIEVQFSDKYAIHRDSCRVECKQADIGTCQLAQHFSRVEYEHEGP